MFLGNTVYSVFIVCDKNSSASLSQDLGDSRECIPAKLKPSWEQFYYYRHNYCPLQIPGMSTTITLIGDYVAAAWKEKWHPSLSSGEQRNKRLLVACSVLNTGSPEGIWLFSGKQPWLFLSVAVSLDLEDYLRPLFCTVRRDTCAECCSLHSLFGISGTCSSQKCPCTRVVSDPLQTLVLVFVWRLGQF